MFLPESPADPARSGMSATVLARSAGRSAGSAMPRLGPARRRHIVEGLLQRTLPEALGPEDAQEILGRRAAAEFCAGRVAMAPDPRQERVDPGPVGGGGMMHRGRPGPVGLACADIEAGHAQERRLA